MQSNTESNSKVHSTKTVYQSRHFRVNQVQIERNGKQFTKDIIEETPIVIVLPYTNEQEIYLASEYRDAFGKEMLNTIGGKVEDATNLLDQAKAELREEAGLKAATWKHVATWETSPILKKKIFVFFASDLEETKQALEEDEQITVVNFGLDEAFQKIASGEISVSFDVAAILLFDKLRKEKKL